VGGYVVERVANTSRAEGDRSGLAITAVARYEPDTGVDIGLGARLLADQQQRPVRRHRQPSSRIIGGGCHIRRPQRVAPAVEPGEKGVAVRFGASARDTEPAVGGTCDVETTVAGDGD